MAYRTLEMTLISAKDLRNVNLLSKMEVYAIASISGDPRSKQRTLADRDGGTNPTWNHTFKFTVPDQDPGRIVIHVLLRSERALGDRDVGEVHVPLRELLDASKAAVSAGDEKKPATSSQYVSYQVRTLSSGKSKGILNISYKLKDLVTVAAPLVANKISNPVGAYPTPAPYNSSDPYNAYPPPPAHNFDAHPAPTSVYPPPAPHKFDDPATAYPPPTTAYPPPAHHKSDDPATAYPPPTSSKANEPVTAYPATSSSAAYPPPGGPQGGYAYGPAPPQHYGGHGGYPPASQAGYGGYPPPPPQGGYGYPPPPQGGYGYGAPQGGYGYIAPPQVAQPARKNKLGMGLGAGLLGGALGGMLIGDMVSDAGSYDAGYDDGFGDGFGDGVDF